MGRSPPRSSRAWRPGRPTGPNGRRTAGGGPDARYSPAEGVGCDKRGVGGSPGPDHVSTGDVARQNRTTRMRTRRLTRLTDDFAGKPASHEHAIALHNMHDDFARRHRAPRVTPGMAAGVARKGWAVEGVVRPSD